MPPDDVTTAIERALSAISVARPNWQNDPNLWSAIDLEYFQSVVEALEAWPHDAAGCEASGSQTASGSVQRSISRFSPNGLFTVQEKSASQKRSMKLIVSSPLMHPKC